MRPRGPWLKLPMSTYTLLHVVISLVGIASGIVVVWGLLGRRRLDAWTLVFLTTTAATSLTGFGFPFTQLLPSHVVGAISLVTLAVAAVARYPRRLMGAWRRAYAITAVVSLYFNVFVLVVQLFLKVPALQSLAPTQSEPPFQVAQLGVLVVFVWLGVAAARRFGTAE
jgi:hypothetical protein